MPIREGVTRAGFQIELEVPSLLQSFKGQIKLQFLGPVLPGVHAGTRIVVAEPLPEIGGVSDISLAGIREAFEDIGEVHFESNNERGFRSANKD